MTQSPLPPLSQRVLTTFLCLLLSEPIWAADTPSNVARLATVTASSERNERLAARFVADGNVPAVGCRDDDNQAWAANGNNHPDGVTLAFAWEQPTPVSTIVYYGRTAWSLDLCWKDYEVYVDDSPEPVAKGVFKRGHGPQVATLPAPVRTRKLVLKFLSHYSPGGSPGASEVQLFTAPPSPAELMGTFSALENVAAAATVTASSEHSAEYLARFAVDGKFPAAGNKEDANQAWAASGRDHPEGVTLSFAWKAPTPVATVVYYARSAWGVDAGWRDYELYVDDQSKPTLAGAFKRGRGPQPIHLPKPVHARKLVLKFLTHHARNSSPGADEVQIFSEPPPASALTGVFTTLAKDLRYAYYPSHHCVRFVVPVPPEEATEWQAVVTSDSDGAPLAETVGKMPLSPAGETLRVPELPAGRYRLRLTFTGGPEPVVDEGVFERRRFDWEGQKLGLDDVLVPPFEPLTADLASQTVGSVLRQHRHGSAGLWRQVVSQKRELLAGPVRLEATSGGKTVAADGAAATFGTVNPTQVTGAAAWNAGPLAGTTTFAYDYDGLMQVTLRLAPTATEIERLQLVIPLKAAEAWLMHPVTVELRQHYAGRIPAGVGKVWDSSQVPNRVGGVFVPYMYVGGPERGICFAADNDRDWIIDATQPAIEIDRAGDTVHLRFNLSARPARLARERTITFALQATPAKPMPDTPYPWRRWWNTRTDPDVQDVQVSFWGGNQYWGGRYFPLSYFPAYMDFGFWEQLAKHRQTGKVEPDYLDQFMARFAGATPAELGNLRNHYREGLRLASVAPVNTAETKKFTVVIPFINPRSCGTENRAFVTTYLDEWQRIDVADPQWDKPGRASRPSGGGVWYDIEPVDSFVDMALFHHRKMYATFADGIYWDNFFLKPCYTPAEAGGPAYVDDAGKLRPGVNLMAFRKLVKRNAVMMHQMGKRPLSFIHMTNVNIVPMLAFGTMQLDWEWRDQGSFVNRDLQDRLGVGQDTGLILAQSLGLQAGNINVAINRFDAARNPAWLMRTVMAVCLPHEIKIHQGDKAVSFAQTQLAKFGYGQSDCTVFRYWDDGFPLKTEGAKNHALVLARGGKAMLALGNYGTGTPSAISAPASAAPTLDEYDAAQLGIRNAPEPAVQAPAATHGTHNVTLTLDLKALGLPDTVRAYDVELRAGQKKAENLAAIRRPDLVAATTAGVNRQDASALPLEFEDPAELKRIAPGVFLLPMVTHDFSLVLLEANE